MTTIKGYLFFIALFCFCPIVLGNSVIVFVDQTHNLDYFVAGKKHRIRTDLENLIGEYQNEKNHRLILVQLTKDTSKKFKGKIIVIGEGMYTKFKFRSKKEVSELLSKYTSGAVDFLFLGHTVTPSKLDNYLSFAQTNYETILASACKMGGIKELNTMAKYTSIVLASPENIHLAHFELKSLATTLSGTPKEKAKKMLAKSFNRLVEYTKSNLVLNIYNVDRSVPVIKSICSKKEALRQLVVATKTKLSKYETSNSNTSQFKIKECSFIK